MEQASEIIIGIDLGTTNSAVAVVDGGVPIVLGNQKGERIIPSAIYEQETGDFLIGSPAKRAGSANPKNLITSTKRLMGQPADSFDQADIFPNVRAHQKELRHVTSQSQLTPPQVSAKILQELKAIAEMRLDQTVKKAVITVPAYFNHSQREATLEAAKIAGLEVERLLNEPTAAALSYGLDRIKDKQTVIVFDLGGGTFDLSILELNDGVFHVLATSGDTQLGGDDIDREIEQWIIQKLQIKESSLDVIQKKRLQESAQKAKCELSNQSEVSLTIPFFNHAQAENIDLTLTRHTFNSLIEPLLQKVRSICLSAISELELPLSQINSIVMVGGSTRIPAVRDLCETIFEQKPNLSENPDESIAIGASIQAGILTGQLKQVLLLDVTPLSLGIETYGGLMNVIIPRNSTIPCKAGEMFTNSVSNQEKMVVRVMQGERELAKDNWQIGEFELNFQPQPRGQARIGIQFSINENGVLEVLGRDAHTNEDTIYQIKDIAVNVADDDVEKMLDASVEHAFDDMHARRLTEVKLKSTELSQALQSVISHYNHLMTDEEKNLFPSLNRDLSNALEQDDLEALKTLNKKVDQHTQSIANRIVQNL